LNRCSKRYANAAYASGKTLEVQRRTLGEDHPQTLVTISNLTAVLEGQGDLLGAMSLARYVFAARKQVLGEGHPDTLLSMKHLALMLWEQGDQYGARQLQRAYIDCLEKVHGLMHERTLSAVLQLADWTK